MISSLINILFCLLLGGNFPIYLLNQLTGIDNLYFSLFSFLSTITFIKNGISFRLRKEDIILLILISYILIYFLFINEGLDNRWLNFLYDIFKGAIGPYILGRIIYKQINSKFLKSRLEI